jgi:hypothetical protein
MTRTVSRRADARRLVTLVAFAAAFILAVWPRSAQAYTWMIRHDYGGCLQCHADPSGGGPLTEYGRAQGDLLLRMRYGSQAEEPDSTAGFLWGAWTPPEWFMPGGDVRGLGLLQKANGAPATSDALLMQADLRAAVAAGGFRAGGSIGGVTSQGSAASVAGGFVSREHWVGWSFGDSSWLVRAGRINVPFGVRMIEHTLFVRRDTRTDLNDTQQHGVALAYSGEKLRGEILAIAGNYQIQPDAYRERGYSSYLEYMADTRLGIGVSSLVTHANTDLYLHTGDLRQAHGLFARFAPWRPLVLLAEGDVVLHALDGPPNLVGYTSVLQADVEPIQGLHFIATGEARNTGAPNTGFSYGAWAGVNWFFLPHADLRVDGVYQRLPLGTALDTYALLGQLHLYL